MNKKLIMGAVIVILVFGLLLGFWLNSGKNITDQTPEATGKGEEVKKTADVTIIKIQPSPIVIPPTMTPFTDIIKSVDDTSIRLTGKTGTGMMVPKNPSIVKVFKRSGENLIPASFSDLSVGQRVTLKIIVPGKQAELIIEP